MDINKAIETLERFRKESTMTGARSDELVAALKAIINHCNDQDAKLIKAYQDIDTLTPKTEPQHSGTTPTEAPEQPEQDKVE